MSYQKIRNRTILGLLILWACVLALQAAEVRIKVVVENASIRSKPGIEGAVIEEKIPLGAVYLSSKKEGEWYEVKFRSRLGVQLTGYINQMYVEVIEEGKEATGISKQIPEFTGAGLERKPAIFEIGLLFGLSAGSFMNGQSTYSDTWAYIELVSVKEQGLISHSIKNSFMSAGGFLTFYVGGGLGFRLGVDYNPKQTVSGGNSNFTMSWTWTQASGGIAGSREKDWPLSGDFSVMPLSLDLVYKFQAGPSLTPYFMGGVTYFAAKANLNTTIGFGNSWLSTDLKTQYIDYFIIPVTLNKKLDKLGGNVGAGLDFLVSPNLAFNVDAVYYIGPPEEVVWPVLAGSYPANYYDVTLNLSGPGAVSIQGKMSKLNFKLSYFRIAGGLKILF